MMEIIIYDFEVFKYDVLLGCKFLRDGSYFQTWDKEEIKEFYQKHIDDIWVGHNISHYDNYILQSIIQDKNPHTISKKIIDDNFKGYLNISLNYFDLMQNHMGSLKVIEGACGKNISESGVDFDTDRELDIDEMTDTERYNRDDLDQSMDDLLMIINEFQLVIDIINEFNLSLDCLHYTQAKISAEVLQAKRIHGIDNQIIKPILYPNLKLNNQAIKDFFLTETFKTGQKLKIKLCGVEHTLGDGGIHGARNKIYCKEALYFDVSGYYNLIMINYDLLPRSIPQKGKELYEFMYHEQLKLKKTNPQKRKLYKTILLSVYGAMGNEYCDFYDPQKRSLVTATGQMFLCDLLEKVEPYVNLIQTNTDGVIAELKDKSYEQQIVDVINEWQERTKFNLKLEKIYDIFQRDVNNYMYKDSDGNIHTLGEAVKYYECWENPLEKNSYMSKEPIIIHYGIVDFLMNNVSPEETVEKYKDNLRMFQYICKKGTFDWTELEEVSKEGIKTIKLQKVNRAFASNSKTTRGMIYKRKYEGKVTKSKVSNLPDNVFVYNESVVDKNISDKIDYNYYVDRIYERINEFI